MSDPITVINLRGETVELEYDFGMQAQREAEDHMTRVWAHFHAEEEDEAEGDSPAIGAFDGCQTCEVRETLMAAMPFIAAGLAREGEGPDRPLVFNLVRCPQEPADLTEVKDALLDAFPAETGQSTHLDLVNLQAANLAEKGLLRDDA